MNKKETNEEQDCSAFAFNTALLIEQYINKEVGDIKAKNRELEAKILDWAVNKDNTIEFKRHFGIQNGRRGNIKKYKFTITTCPGYESYKPDNLTHEVCKNCGSIHYYH